MPSNISVLNLADIYDRAQRSSANEQAMALQDMKMQAAMADMRKQKSLRDLVSSSYTPASPAVPFETDEEAFMGQPSLTGLTAQPATRARMDYGRLEQGLAQMGDYEGLMKVRQQRAGSDISKAHQEKIKAAQSFVDAGDQEGLRQFVLADDETPDDVDVVTNQDGSMTMTSSQWPEPRTIRPSAGYQKQQASSKYMDAIAKRGSARSNTLREKLAAIQEMNLSPEEERQAMLAALGAAPKVGGRDPRQADAIAAYNAQFPINQLTGKRPEGAPPFEQFVQGYAQPALPTAPPPAPTAPKVTPEGYEIIGQNPDGTLTIRDPKTGRTGKYRP